ncbi:metallophosphoesterase [Rhodoferax sp.]|uniref:metallophosphoesterase n=1 Tax=Rhodoferax sp. TaxID=50421 RepID=UPI00374D6F81
MALAPVFFLSAVLHALLGWRLASDLSLQLPLYGHLFWAWVVVSAVLMPMGMVSLRFARPPMRAALTWLGLLCMGLFSSLFVLTLLREVALGLLWLVYQFHAFDLSLGAVASLSAMAIPPLALLMSAVGFLNARRTAAVVRVNVPIADLPAALEGFSIAQISDIHVGPTIKKRYLERIVQRVNGLNADLVAITGDLVDGTVKSLGGHVSPLADLRSLHGTFFVTGNHEYYSGAHAWIDKLRSLGLKVLLNEHVVIHHGTAEGSSGSANVLVAGVADFGAHHFDQSHRSDPQLAMGDKGHLSAFKLLLAHQPRSAPAAEQAGFDLQLSGHTHGGQFWPWGYFVRFQQPFTEGLHKLKNLWVYTNRGTGYWGPPKRLGVPSEITHLRLVRATA